MNVSKHDHERGVVRDAPPTPPPEPDPLDCCGEGCVNCIFDVYDMALERYEIALKTWQDQHPEAESKG